MSICASWPAKFTAFAALLLALAISVMLTGPARAEPATVVFDQSPDDPPQTPPLSWRRPFVSVQKDGVFVAGRRVTDATLGSVLAEEFKRVSGRQIYVRADPDLSLGEVLRVYEAIEAAGFEGKVRMVNEDLD